MLDLVPFARARRQMANRDRNSGSSSELLQFDFPKAQAHAIAAAAIGGDHQTTGRRIRFGAHRLPPAANGLDGKRRRIMIDSDADPADIVAEVVDAIGNSLAHSGSMKS